MCVSAAVAATLATAGCGGGTTGPTVFCAASTADALRALSPRATLNVAGSDQLAFQIRQGARADVFVSASAVHTDALHAEGLVEAPVVIARNRLVIITPPHAGPRSAADLGRARWRVVLGTHGVPVGAYAERALAAMGMPQVAARAVSREPDVRGIIAKVTLGEADAGVVYATDARAAGDAVRTLPIPERAQPDIAVTAAVVRSAPHPDAARALLAVLRGPEGRRELARLGFLPPP